MGLGEGKEFTYEINKLSEKLVSDVNNRCN